MRHIDAYSQLSCLKLLELTKPYNADITLQEICDIHDVCAHSKKSFHERAKHESMYCAIMLRILKSVAGGLVQVGKAWSMNPQKKHTAVLEVSEV